MASAQAALDRRFIFMRHVDDIGLSLAINLNLCFTHSSFLHSHLILAQLNEAGTLNDPFSMDKKFELTCPT